MPGVRAVMDGAGPVVNDHISGCAVVPTSAAPWTSRMAVVPPISSTVYRVSAARLALGLRIHWFVVPLRVTPAVTTGPVTVPAWSRKVVPDTPLTASLNVAVMLLATGTAVAFRPGALAVTVGAGFTTVRDWVVLSGETLPAASTAR